MWWLLVRLGAGCVFVLLVFLSDVFSGDSLGYCVSADGEYGFLGWECEISGY